ncbi:MAG: efflux RND transporter permease subunit [Bacillota bacterium]|nr:efflux RND transporter permease subunit [Bacillota bacterium]
MSLSSASVRRPVTTFMAVLVVLVLGFVSLTRLAMDLLPKLNLPFAAVLTTYRGAGPQEIETLITRPQEEVLGLVGGVDSILSYSQRDQAIVLVSFTWGTDMNFATLEMREKLDLIKRYLPEGAEAPVVLKADPSMMPILQYGIAGDGDPAALKRLVEDVFKQRLERLSGVASVGVQGGLEREIVVAVDPLRLQFYGLTLEQVVQALKARNLTLPGGPVRSAGRELLIRTSGEFAHLEDLRDLPLPAGRGGMIRLRDVAEVRDGYKDVTAYTRLNRKPSLALVIYKETDANTVQVARRVKAEVERIQKELSVPLTIKPVFDQSEFIEKAIRGVAQNALLGAVLAVLVLWLFLRDWRPTLIIATAIPISIVATFTLIYFGDLTLNLMSLGGLALGVGMLVDNAIVVLENIYRYRQEGHDLLESAVQGSDEVGMAISASTFTTVAVFLPIVFVEGLASQLFRELALTVSFSLLASLVMALTLVPVLATRLLGADERLAAEERGLFARVKMAYRRLLEAALRRRRLTLGVAGGLFLASLALVPLIGGEFIPTMDAGSLSISVQMPRGTALEVTDRVVTRIEEVLAARPDVETILSQVGGVGEFAMLGAGSAGDAAQVAVRLWGKDRRRLSSQEVAEELRQALRDIPGAEIKVTPTSAFGGAELSSWAGAPVQIEIRGDDLAVLKELGDEVTRRARQVRGLREVSSSLEQGQPELVVRLLPEKAASYGFSAAQVASAVRTAVQGEVATRYRAGGEEVDVRVRLDEEYRRTPAELARLLITSPLGAKVPLSEVAELRIEEGPHTIERKGQARIVTVTADLVGRDLGSAVRELRQKLADLPLPPGYHLEYGGQNEEMTNAFRDLTLAFLLAVLLVYMIMAAQFESLVHPLTIMFSVPLAAVGVLWALFLTGTRLSVPAFIGIIMLAGIVVNNAIVLVDYINTLRRRGMERDQAILAAGPVRLRPVLMTTLTTVLGLVPLAMGRGEGAEMDAPLGIVVIGGLSASTLLTLVVVPVIYSIFDDWGRRYQRWRARRRGETRTAAAELR